MTPQPCPLSGREDKHHSLHFQEGHVCWGYLSCSSDPTQDFQAVLKSTLSLKEGPG